MDPSNKQLRGGVQQEPTAIQCPLCGDGIPRPSPETAQNDTDEAAFTSFEKHFEDSHAEMLDAKESEAEKAEAIRLQWQAALSSGRFVVANLSPRFSFGLRANTHRASRFVTAAKAR